MSEGGRSEENNLVENGVELRRGGSEMNSRLMSLLLPFPELSPRERSCFNGETVRSDH